MPSAKHNTYSMHGEQTATGSVLIFEGYMQQCAADELELIRIVNSPKFVVTRITVVPGGTIKIYVDHPVDDYGRIA